MQHSFIFSGFIYLFIAASCTNPAETLQTQVAAPVNEHQGAKLFDEKCSVCHFKTLSAGVNGIVSTAPEVEYLNAELRKKFIDSQGNFIQDDAINFIVDYVYNPEESKSILPGTSKSKYGLMPSLKGSVTPSELRLISEFILNSEVQQATNQ